MLCSARGALVPSGRRIEARRTSAGNIRGRRSARNALQRAPGAASPRRQRRAPPPPAPPSSPSSTRTSRRSFRCARPWSGAPPRRWRPSRPATATTRAARVGPPSFIPSAWPSWRPGASTGAGTTRFRLPNPSEKRARCERPKSSSSAPLACSARFAHVRRACPELRRPRPRPPQEPGRAAMGRRFGLRPRGRDSGLARAARQSLAERLHRRPRTSRRNCGARLC